MGADCDVPQICHSACRSEKNKSKTVVKKSCFSTIVLWHMGSSGTWKLQCLVFLLLQPVQWMLRKFIWEEGGQRKELAETHNFFF